MTSPDLRSPIQVAFWEELRLRGYVEGKNLVVERRNAAGQVDLCRHSPESWSRFAPTYHGSDAATQPCGKDATSTIPIVIIGVADPVGLGLVTSLAHPGGNVTGVTTLVSGNLAAKSMQLVREMVPSAKRIAMLVNPTNEMHRDRSAGGLQAALQLGIQMQVHEAQTGDEIGPALRLRSPIAPRR